MGGTFEWQVRAELAPVQACVRWCLWFHSLKPIPKIIDFRLAADDSAPWQLCFWGEQRNDCISLPCLPIFDSDQGLQYRYE